jgi:hypothetical protein
MRIAQIACAFAVLIDDAHGGLDHVLVMAASPAGICSCADTGPRCCQANHALAMASADDNQQGQQGFAQQSPQPARSGRE